MNRVGWGEYEAEEKNQLSSFCTPKDCTKMTEGICTNLNDGVPVHYHFYG